MVAIGVPRKQNADDAERGTALVVQNQEIINNTDSSRVSQASEIDAPQYFTTDWKAKKKGPTAKYIIIVVTVIVIALVLLTLVPTTYSSVSTNGSQAHYAPLVIHGAHGTSKHGHAGRIG